MESVTRQPGRQYLLLLQRLIIGQVQGDAAHQSVSCLRLPCRSDPDGRNKGVALCRTERDFQTMARDFGIKAALYDHHAGMIQLPGGVFAMSGNGLTTGSLSRNWEKKRVGQCCIPANPRGATRTGISWNAREYQEKRRARF